MSIAAIGVIVIASALVSAGLIAVLLPTLRRFLPYLWPAGETGLKARIVVAMLLVVASKIVQVFGAAYTLKYAVDRMSVGDRSLVTIVVLLVIGYAASRFSTFRRTSGSVVRSRNPAVARSASKAARISERRTPDCALNTPLAGSKARKRSWRRVSKVARTLRAASP